METITETGSAEIDKRLKFIKESAVEIVDLRFTDISGQCQHFSILPMELKELHLIDRAYAAFNIFKKMTWY